MSRPANERDWSWVPRLVLVVGVGGVALGVLLLVGQWLLPGRAAGLARLGEGWQLGLLAVLAAAEGLVVALLSRRAGGTTADLPTPEPPAASAPAPGDAFDPSSVGGRRQVRELAVATLAEVEGVDEAVARQRVEAGEWPAPPSAAAYLGADVVVPLRQRLWDWLATTPREALRARRAVAAVRALSTEGER